MARARVAMMTVLCVCGLSSADHFFTHKRTFEDSLRHNDTSFENKIEDERGPLGHRQSEYRRAGIRGT